MSPKSAQHKAVSEKIGSLTDKAYQELEERIVTLRLRPGEVLSETALSEQLGIGRTPIREALQRLALEGLVVILPRKGILVSDINPGKQLLVLEVRRELDGLMARAGSVRRTEEERDHFLEIAAGMEQAASENDAIKFMRYDNEYNVLVATAAHNEYVVRAIGLMNSLSRRFWYVHYKETADLPHCARLHAAVARCIAEGDTEGASEASDRLIDYVETFTRATVNTTPVR
ncbi:MAG: GntR family transcriptional regulator [Rhodospirillaceae bacterium]|jgi:DNA-binding GntR family transcriptional regulator|nr:GntR family transcriptional regulator [Rhodospirillaceae bacterium]MBT5243638.1 GntR family transcriptional regulator [Rhodospirillaceae bacterium]MBT5561982.1 GntR family transcriptional regulator [Rhodospirillaceae bacterium]MBT6240395.1 GntR family transcriptional regulator [Rhodospirillaceae bacterium]